MGDQRCGEWHIEPWPQIAEIVLPRHAGQERAQHEGDEDGGNEQSREEAQETRHGVIDQSRLRQHAAGDEKARDDEEHIDREPADLEPLHVDKFARGMALRHQGEAVVEQHRGRRGEPDKVKVIISAVKQSGDRLRHAGLVPACFSTRADCTVAVAKTIPRVKIG